MFKADWEKTSAIHLLPQGMVERMLRFAYPNKKLISHELIAGGCANLNIKILVEDQESPQILRVYLRDRDAGYREKKIGILLKQTVPVPQTHTMGEVEDYCFAITTLMPGISLRDFLLSEMPHDMSSVMHDVGVTLAKISSHAFAQAGFFDKDLKVMPHVAPENYLSFAKECLENETILSVLTSEMVSNIRQVFDRYGDQFPDKNEKNLVHADFDPSNILVNEVNGLWKVSGVLDWEFAFSGSVWWDVANMLRYAHKMPSEFEDAFLKGLASGGIDLPGNGDITIRLLNLVSLLDCLKRSDPKGRPKQCADIYGLISYILTVLNTTF